MSTVLVPLVSTGITFNEVPEKMAYYIELGGCFMHCANCHSPELQQDSPNMPTIAEVVLGATKAVIGGANAIVVLGGTTSRQFDKYDLLEFLKELSSIAPTCLYSGSDDEEEDKRIATLGGCTWLKTGQYIEALGGLDSTRTNQRFLKREQKVQVDKEGYVQKITTIWDDQTHKFWKRVK